MMYTAAILSIPLIAAFLLKQKLVKTEDGKKSTFREFAIDFSKFVIVYVVLIVANILFGVDFFKVSTMIVDSIFVSIALFLILTKNYLYPERKAIFGLVSLLLMMAIFAMTILLMILGTYDVSYAFLYLKLLFSFLVSLFAALTSESHSFSSKFKSFFNTILFAFKNYNMTKMDYLVFSILSLFAFVGDPNGFLTPVVAIFGIQDIMRKKYIKGACYIISGTIILMLDYSLLGEVLILLYSLIAMIDICWTFFKFKKINLQKKSI
ncbi:hypothetical protein [Lysinibacillus capsici]|uniref:hypothetical protein n=1 Tax=Lysinibacillus capsici TaxID=2115968 RepID=UPI002DB6EC4F|nr:hypothetical protein [Lysinibacillus capsici]MEC1305436.1 hypothetical protein [Lysinibacillus capsici]